MKQLNRKNFIPLCLLLVGMLAAVVLLGPRIVLEQENRHISVVMSYPDAQQLAAASGVSTERCLERLASGGLSAVVLPEEGGTFDAAAAETVHHAGLGLILSPADDMTLPAYLAAREELGADYSLYLSAGGAVQDLAGSGLTIGLVEDDRQYTHEPVPGFDSMAESAPMARVFRLLPEYQARYGVYGYEGAEEIENILYRAATDRSIRVLWLAPFLDPDTGAVIGNLSEYTGLLEHLSTRLLPHGLLLDGTIYPIADYSLAPVLLFLCSLGLVAAAVLLLETFLRLSRRSVLLLVLLGALISAAGLFLEPRLTVKMMALGAAVAFPCLAAYRLFVWANGQSLTIRRGPGSAAASGALALLGGLGITLAGCLFVGAILSDAKYLLSIDTFTGVKASQALPLLYALLISAFLFWYRPGTPLSQQLRGLLSRFSRRSLLFLLLFALILVCAAAFFVYGTGDEGFLRGGLLERRFRNFLEAAVLVRPRLKEFLVAWPALVLAFYLAGRNYKGWAWLLLLPSAAGFASVCNTFCHIRASVLSSLIRTLYGACFGYLIGLACLFLVWLLFLRRKA